MRIHQSGSFSSAIVAGTRRGSSNGETTAIAAERSSSSGSLNSSMAGSMICGPKMRSESMARSRAKPASVLVKRMYRITTSWVSFICSRTFSTAVRVPASPEATSGSRSSRTCAGCASAACPSAAASSCCTE
jgi:hypothetical protein